MVPAPAFARVSRPKAKAVDETELTELETAQTQMLKQPAASNRRHGSAVASSDDGASREDASKAPETITRKLGRRKPIERAAAPAMPKKPSKAATPVPPRAPSRVSSFRRSSFLPHPPIPKRTWQPIRSCRKPELACRKHLKTSISWPKWWAGLQVRRSPCSK